MDELLKARSATFDRLVAVWNGGDPDGVSDLITASYRGHMLHLQNGERSGPQYPQWVRDYRMALPGVRFEVVDQASSGDRLWTRLVATMAGTSSGANGMNVSRFEGERIAEEWAIWSDWH